MNIFKELPIVLPFYDNVENQDRYRENVKDINQWKLNSPNNSLLPFQIEMPADKPAPVKWEVQRIGGTDLDITNNLSKIKVYSFSDKKQAVYKGDSLQFIYESIDEPLNLPCGHYYTKFTFPDGSYYVSELFYVVHDLSKFIKIEFWNDTDLGPIIYRDEFKQVIYIDSFVNSFVPEIDEETEKDGLNREIPVFQKLSLKYKFVDVVPDFIKIVLIALQMKDNVYIYINESRSGNIDRVEVTTQPVEGTGLNDIEVIFEDNILLKSHCDVNKVPTNITTW